MAQLGRGVREVRDAEVGEDDTVLGQEHVVRLDVAVDDPRPVRLGQRVEDGGADLGHPLHGHPAPAADGGGQGLPADQLHDDDGGAVVFHDVMDGDDPRVAESDRCASLAGEPPEQRGTVVVVHALREEDLLDGDLTSEELLVQATPDPAHTALADTFDQLVPAGDEFGILLGHAHTLGPAEPIT